MMKVEAASMAGKIGTQGAVIQPARSVFQIAIGEAAISITHLASCNDAIPIIAPMPATTALQTRNGAARAAVAVASRVLRNLCQRKRRSAIYAAHPGAANAIMICGIPTRRRYSRLQVSNSPAIIPITTLAPTSGTTAKSHSANPVVPDCR